MSPHMRELGFEITSLAQGVCVSTLPYREELIGDPVTGVQVRRMTEGLDEGPVLASETVRIGPLDTAGTLHDRMAEAG